MSDSGFASLRESLQATDPGLMNLRAALRSVLGLGATLLLALPLTHLTGQPASVAFLGAVLAMVGPLMIADPTLAQQRVTQWLILIPILICLPLGIWLAPWHLASLIVFLCLSFVAVAMRRWGLRFLGLGMVALMSYFFALFFKVPLASTPWVCGVAVIATGVMHALRFWILTERPEALLRLHLKAFDARLGLCFSALSRLLGAQNTEADWQRLQNHWLKLGEQGLELEVLINQQPLVSRELKLGLYEQELGMGRLLETSWILTQTATAELRAQSAELIDSLHDWLRQQRPDATALQNRLESLVTQAERLQDPLLSRALLSQAAAISSYLAPELDEAALPEAPEIQIPLVQNEPGPGIHAATRQAIQATLATALASLAGGTLAPDYWPWAALSAFVIFIGSTRGNYLLRASQRVLGTALGLGAGMLLAYLLTRSPGTEIALLLLSVFSGVYLIRTAYAWAMFSFSAQLALLYSLMGKLTPALLQLRLEQTLIGAACGALVAVWVLPARTRPAIHQALAGYFRSLSELLTGLGERAPSQLLAQTRRLDTEVRELRTLATPLLDARMPRGSLRLQGILLDLQRLSYYLRQVTVLLGQGQADSELMAQITSSAQVLAARSARLSASLQDDELRPQSAPLLGSLILEPLPLPSTTVPACHWLLRIDQLMNRLAQRLELEDRLGP
jgi:hypothetical protein